VPFLAAAIEPVKVRQRFFGGARIAVLPAAEISRFSVWAIPLRLALVALIRLAFCAIAICRTEFLALFVGVPACGSDLRGSRLPGQAVPR
jgi:hypothetical protein